MNGKNGPVQHNGVLEPQQLAVLTRFDWDRAGAAE